ncbi:MAG: TldD/PmbA family protein [Deltaproteobacteria bacterium]|nr:TldD/PmbA family protein [Deltaproteobacteria bacterium]
MLQRASVEKLIPILRQASRRALRMKVSGFPGPYYTSFLLRDIHWFNTWSSAGSVYRKRSDHTRNVYCDLRVGSYRYDQTTNGGLQDNDEELESMNHITAPIDDRAHDALRLALWRLSEAKFREALSDYSTKESNRISTPDPNRHLASFHKLKRHRSVKYKKPEAVDEEKWTHFCKVASRWISELQQVSSSWVEFDAAQETKIFVNSEHRIVVQHQLVFSLSATLRKLTSDGHTIEQDLVLNCGSQSELPDMRAFKRAIMKKYTQLQRLIRAKTIHAFSGPVLLAPAPAGLLFHEAIGHRLEGGRLLSAGEGQTFKGQEGKRVLNVDLTIRDNPKLRSFQGVRCIGAYDFDDEGTPARNAELIRDGVLLDFLSTRAALRKKGFVPNGHARNKKFQRPISRMGVTIVEGKDGLSFERLKELLIEQIKEQGKPFGMIVYETSGGETETTSYDFQAFSGEISFATLVYPNGKEVCVRGVNFVGTPLQALNNILAVGSELEIDNGYCGAESGFIPVTTISPAILLSNLELQAKDETLVAQYILPRPRREEKPPRLRRRRRKRK